MHSYFPAMLNTPERQTTVPAITYFFFAFFIFPFVGVLFTFDESQMLYGAWIDILYHLCNFLVAGIIFLPYLKESFQQIMFEGKLFWSTVGICSAAVIVFKLILFMISYFIGEQLFFSSALGSLLTSEMDLQYLSTFLALEQPIWGTLVLVLICPIAISCLFYGCVFNPIAYKRPWLGYVATVATLVLLRGLMIFCFWDPSQQIALFFITLPVHLIACLSYHITDTIWAPIAVHSISNAVLALLTHLVLTPML